MLEVEITLTAIRGTATYQEDLVEVLAQEVKSMVVECLKLILLLQVVGCSLGQTPHPECRAT